MRRHASTALLLERERQVSSYLAATLRVTAALAEASDADTAFTQLLPALCEQLDWDAATLWQPSPRRELLVHTGTWTAPGRDVTGWSAASPGRAFARGEGLPGLAWRHGGPVVVADLGTDDRIPRAAAARADGLHTGVAFPLLHGETLLGVCELLSARARPVPAELREVLAGAGRQIGQFLVHLQAESDLRHLADTLQRRLLPARLPTVPGIDLAADYRPAGRGMLVGGDTYDVLPLPEGRWMALIADVCGHGAEAAAVTALTRHTARAAAVAGAGPAQVLAAVNAALLREQDGGSVRFVTACCLLLHPEEAGVDLRLSVAGHPLPLLRADTGAITEIGATDPPLGISRTTTYRETTLGLAPDEAVVLYTDGLTEARNDAGGQFGEGSLIDVLAHTGTASAQITVETITAAVDRHARRSHHHADDLAVLVLRLPPRIPTSRSADQQSTAQRLAASGPPPRR